MFLQDVFSRQIMAFHGAIMDNCNRAADADRSDTMVLRLRNNALALAKIQLAMLALTGTELPEPETGTEPWREPETGPEPWRDPEPAEPQIARPLMAEPQEAEPQEAEPWEAAEPSAFDGERVLAGDALSRFVSRPMASDESPHEVWQRELDNDPVRRRRNPVLPGAGFRSPST
jgi:hypothetical protein